MTKLVAIKGMKDDETLLELSRARVPFVVKVANSERSPLTELEAVLATIAVANGATISLVDELGRKQSEEEIKSWYEMVRFNLATALHMPADMEFHKKFRRTANAMVDRTATMRIKPMLRWEVDGVSFHYFHDFPLGFSVLDYGCLLLVDRNREFRKKLCVCQLRECRRYFIVKKPVTGRPQRRYCCAEHMKLAHERGAKQRARNARNGIRTRDGKPRTELESI